MKRGPVTCPVCGDEIRAGGLDGHLRLAHPGNQLAQELVGARRVANRARRAENEMGKDGPYSSARGKAVESCRKVRERAERRVEDIVDELQGKG